jgi:magnesium transporter
MINTLYLPELREMLADGDVTELSEFCTALHPARTAEFMEGLTADECWQFLRHAPLGTRGQIFSFIDVETQIEVLETQDRTEIAELVVDMAADDRVDILDDIDENVVEELLPLMPTEERREYLRLRSYPEGTAGAVMTTEAAKLGEELTVGAALKELSRQAMELETIYYLFIIDDKDHLRGLVSTRQLVSSMGDTEIKLSELMETDLITVDVLEDQEEVAQKVARYNLLAIPVVDHEHRMLGIITHDDIIDVVLEEAREDAHRIAAVEPFSASYSKTSMLMLSWKRGIWLTVLFLFALLTAAALRHYDVELRKWGWLAWFLPLIISSGGNTGSQTATLIITAMAFGDIQPSDWFKVVMKELGTGLILGGFLATIGFVAAALMANSVYDAIVIPITLVLVVLCGTFSGAVLPLLFRRLGLDPALMSSPFVAGIIDLVGIIVYINVAILVLSR